jgi:ABC-type dipeptide/oligopeptide/nickel transport system permease subunit
MTVTDLETLGAGQPDETPTETSSRKIVGKSPTRIALERLRADKVAVGCAVVVAILVLLGIFAPLICSLWNIKPDDPPPGGAGKWIYLGYPVVGPPFHGFTWSHPLGLSTNSAYDNMARLLFGLRTSLIIATVATVATTIIGVVVGLMAGYSRGVLDRVIGFLTDIFLAFPFILGALALAPIITSHFADQPDALARAQFLTLISVLVIFGWMPLARLIRGQVLSLREREFIQAAQVMGAPTRRVLFKELLPNLIAPIVVSVSLTLPAYVAAEAVLSYLGLGLTGTPSLGQMILAASGSFSIYPLYLWAPVITITMLVLSLNLLGDAIRDAFDPKTRR